MVSPSGARRLLRQPYVRQPEPHPSTVAQWLRTLTSRRPISVGMAAFLLAAAAFPYRSLTAQPALPQPWPLPMLLRAGESWLPSERRSNPASRQALSRERIVWV